MSKKKSQCPEREIQKDVVTWLRNLGLCGDEFPNFQSKFEVFGNLEGLNKSPIQGRFAKTQGMQKGRPDLEIFLSEGRTLFIELKIDGGKLRVEQKQMHQSLINLGHFVFTLYCKDKIHAIQQLTEILEDHGIAC